MQRDLFLDKNSWHFSQTKYKQGEQSEDVMTTTEKMACLQMLKKVIKDWTNPLFNNRRREKLSPDSPIQQQNLSRNWNVTDDDLGNISTVPEFFL